MSLASYSCRVSRRVLTPFGQRLLEVLHGHGEHATQAWLGERSGVDRSLISRMIAGTRQPTLVTLQALAPALEIDLAELVAGTDAELRVEAGADFVRRTDFERAVGESSELRSRASELEVRIVALEERLADAQKARALADAQRSDHQTALDQANAKLRETELRCAALVSQLDQYKAAWRRAVSQFGTLRQQLEQLKKEIGDRTKAGAILAGIAAAAGVATLGLLAMSPADKSSPL